MMSAASAAAASSADASFSLGCVSGAPGAVRDSGAAVWLASYAGSAAGGSIGEDKETVLDCASGSGASIVAAES